MTQSIVGQRIISYKFFRLTLCLDFRNPSRQIPKTKISLKSQKIKMMVKKENLEKFEFCQKIAIPVKNFDLCQKISHLVKISILVKKFIFSQKFRFLSKISIFLKNFDFCHKFRFLSKIWIFVKNFDFVKKFSYFWSKS